MNKQAIRDFSQRARKKLIEDVKQRAYILGILEDRILEIESFKGGFRIKERENGIFTEEQKKQRETLIKEIEKKGYEQVMEEVAYTWFNRFIALRFMEINNFLPSGIRVLSSEEKGKAEPDILTQMSLIDLDINWDKIDDIKSSNKNVNQKREEIYKHLLIKQCNQLGSIMPTVFEEISDYTELLLPDNLLGENSIIRDLVESVEEYDWEIELSEEEKEIEEEKGEHGIEIIGWLYQYYISEKKDEVFADLKKNIKISKENIPAATQLFTPKWIVKYMVENSLGRLWLESHPDEELQSKWKYYLEEAEQEEEVKKELEKLKNPDLFPEDIKILDPACGSGHILVYAFDVLYDIYLSQGYSERQIPTLILENNLYGLDIDDRAGQLTEFALMMKARSKNKRIFRRKVELNLVAIQDSEQLTVDSGKLVEYFADGDEKLRDDLEYLIETFEEAKEYGSILEVEPVDFDRLEERVQEIREEVPKMYNQGYRNVILEKLPILIKQGRIMSRKYDVVCTNPPYMGSRGMNGKLKKLISENYDDYKMDLFSVFIIRNLKYTIKKGYTGMMTPYVWMFIKSYEKLRLKIINTKSIISMIQLESSGFAEATVPICTFILKNCNLDLSGIYIKLSEFKGIRLQSIKTLEAINNKNVSYRYVTQSKKFNKIPGSPIAYWVGQDFLDVYSNSDIIDNFTEYSGAQNKTANNDKYLRKHWEVYNKKVGYTWILIAKGGVYRRWYGNVEEVIDWSEKARSFYQRNKTSCLMSEKYLFREGITWTKFSSYSKFGFRYISGNILYETAAPTLHFNKNLKYFLGLLNSIVGEKFIKVTKQSVNCQVFDVVNIPVKFDKLKNELVEYLVKQNISISKTDWDSFETSWDFQRHPLLAHKGDATTIEGAFEKWDDFTNKQFNQLKANEEELNRIFIEIYGLEDELTPEVDEKDVTISKADRERDIKSFISYAVGCMLGRYSLDVDGLIYAGGNWEDKWRFQDGKCIVKDDKSDIWIESSFCPTKTNIIPIADDDYFEEDIVERFIEFVKVTFGEENLEKNLDYIAETLGVRVRETSREAIRRYFLKDFYKDHVRTYKKRPIYWMFNSGKEDGFNALIYMHRYTPDTIAEVRIDYLHSLQRKYEGEVEHLDMVIESDISTREKNQAKKRKEKIMKQINECRIYDQALNHMANQRIDIDLDDGVKVNYEKFQGIKIPGKDGQKPLKINLLAKI